MKFASLYSNQEEVFPAIYFREGFNVIFAQVKDPDAKDQDSHNLGKTFLIQVLNFTLLGDLNKTHPFRAHPDIFDDFIFYLEIETVNAEYVTVKRSVKTGKISLHISDQRNLNLSELPETSWTFSQLPKTKAESKLNELLDLEALIPFSYRKGLGYFMRRQSDYDEVFRISKFQYGADKFWKPFVALLLGLEQELITNKYEIDENINKLANKLEIIEDAAGTKSDEYDEVRGLLEIRQAAIDKMRVDLDSFSFQDIEAQISETNVGMIESEISALNERRYTLDYELQAIENSLDYEPQFDVERIQQVFQEANIALSSSVVRSYEDLIEFNKRLSSGRKERLQKLRQKLLVEREEVEKAIRLLDSQRQESLKILQAKQTLEKYKRLQSVLINREREISELQQRLKQLDQAAVTELEIEDEKQRLSEAITRVRKAINEENQLRSSIRRTFSQFVEQVLKVEALLSVTVNQSGNLEFNVRTLDKAVSERETSEDEGTSYRKILAACFDLTLLSEYSSRRFYRFVYHDGIFEGLDNRRKVSLLNMIRDICNKYGIQYILTVIDSDLPRDESDQKLLFTEKEIVRYLHDRGDDGRLFKTRAF